MENTIHAVSYAGYCCFLRRAINTAKAPAESRHTPPSIASGKASEVLELPVPELSEDPFEEPLEPPPDEDGSELPPDEDEDEPPLESITVT